MNRPTVLVVSRRNTRKSRFIDCVAELHLGLLIRFGFLPIIVPVVPGTLACLPQLAPNMRGLLLVEGEDIEPKRYPAVKANFRYLENTHPLRDEIELRLIRLALRRKLPILAICRGSQLLNVACGGTLFGDVQKENRSPLKHIDYNHYDTYRHPIAIVSGAPLERWYRRRALRVNSYHHQGVRLLAHRFEAMAHSPDGLIEAYYDPRAPFIVGLQFHPERMPELSAGNARIWKAFASAIRRSSRRPLH
jgi:gamma-glutamyl-gamma-aminobutyrate hydrolase PuuD